MSGAGAPAGVPEHGPNGSFIPVRPKAFVRARARVERAQFANQVIQHVPAVVTVLTAGASALRSEREGGALALAAAELLAGAWVIVTIVDEARHLLRRRAEHGGAHTPLMVSGWVDVPSIAAAALGFVEVWHRTHEHHHFKLVSPQMLTALTALVMGVGGRQLLQRFFARRLRSRRPHLRVTPEAVSYRGGRRARWEATWRDVATVEHGDGYLTLRLRDGRAHSLRADDHLDGAELLGVARQAVATYAPATLAGAAGPVSPRPVSPP